MPATVSDLLALFDITDEGEGRYRGPQPNTQWQRLFGGQVLAQSLYAAMLSVPGERLPHSVHGYFMRPGVNTVAPTFNVTALRDGGSFSTRSVSTMQEDQNIFLAVASFQGPEEGLTHTAEQPTDVTSPEDSPLLAQVLEAQFGHPMPMLSEWDALEVRLASGPQSSPQGPRMRAWVKTQAPLPDDPRVHIAVMAYLSDITLLSVAVAQHEVELLSPEVMMASLDHAMWFHRPFRADEWLLYDMVSPSASGARGYCQGRLFQDGHVVASAVQEGLIRIQS